MGAETKSEAKLKAMPSRQLTYAAVIFLLAPLSIATGVAMSPAVSAWFQNGEVHARD